MNILNRGGRHFPAQASISITEQGTEKLLGYKGDPEGRILESLETHGACSVDRVALLSGIGEGRADRLAWRLYRGGFVRLSGRGAGDGLHDDG